MDSKHPGAARSAPASRNLLGGIWFKFIALNREVGSSPGAAQPVFSLWHVALALWLWGKGITFLASFAPYAAENPHLPLLPGSINPLGLAISGRWGQGLSLLLQCHVS